MEKTNKGKAKVVSDKPMTARQFMKAASELFADHTGCGVQWNGNRPCNTCFHAMEGDFKHIVWLMILAQDEGYSDLRVEMLGDIQSCLKKSKRVHR